MGTDDGRKINGKRLLLVRALRCVTHVSKRRWQCILPVLAIASFARLFIFSSYRILPSPELLFFDSFDPSSSDLGPSIPAQCKDVMKQVYRCQDEATITIVLGCHRRWCNSFGHCNECAGIGDRFFNFGMHHIQHAYSGDYPGLLQQQITSSILRGNNITNKCNLKVQFDYPCHGLATLKSATYQDPSGWLGELFRYRSYMKIGNSLQPQFLPHSSSPTTIVGHMMSNFDWHSATTRGSLPTKTADWSGCLFHAYFRPNYYLEDALQYHQKQLNGGTTIRNNDTAIISIHFRVGDGLSFKQLAISEDIRMSNGKTLEDGWEEMKQCAKELVNSSPEYSDKKHIRYVLASDSVDVKRLARNDADIEVYTTDVKPSNFRENPDKDADAWLELFLLSRQDGLVMNGVADMIAYRGRATYASKGSAFALLIEKIGFFRKDQVKVCKM